MSRLPNPNKILAMDPEHLREIDGVVFDLDSYARHCAPQPAPEPAAEPQALACPAPAAPPAAADCQPAAPAAPAPAAPAAVFAVEPQHVGWYEQGEVKKVTYPIMAGAIEPGQAAGVHTIQTGSGSYASSFFSSYATSFATSWATSYYLYGSGSWLSSYFTAGSWQSSYFAGSWQSSYVPGSGSWLTSYFVGPGQDPAPAALFAGGYGLELI